jgi:hypothetical protein
MRRERTQAVNSTRNRQLEYVQTVEEFRSTYNDYREARNEGDEKRARELGRELVRLGEQSERQLVRLNQSYTRLQTATGRNTSGVRTALTDIQDDIDTTRQAVEGREFIRTDLTVVAADRRGSFTDPLNITVQLNSPNGAIDNRKVRLRIGGRIYETETNGSGTVTVRYRPSSVLLNSTTVIVGYLPTNSSVYLASNTTIPIALEGVTVASSVTSETTDIAYSEQFVATGRVSVDGEPVPGLPLAVVVGGEQLGTAVTATNGTFTFTGRLPAGATPGEQNVTLRNVPPSRAVSAEPASDAVRIRETTTSISANLTRKTGVILISGRLTAGDRPVPDEPLSILSAGSRLTTVRTDANGSYVFQLSLGDLGQTAVITYNGAGKNLRSSELSVTVAGTAGRVGAATNQPQSVQEWINQVIAYFSEREAGLFTFGGVGVDSTVRFLTSPFTLVASGLVFGLGGFVLSLVRRWQRDSNDVSTDSIAGGNLSSQVDHTGRSSIDFQSLLEEAKADLQTGATDDVIIRAYAIARAVLLQSRPGERAGTHWQFFETQVARGVTSEKLRTLTEAYEIARYGAEEASVSMSERAIDAAQSIVDSDN